MKPHLVAGISLALCSFPLVGVAQEPSVAQAPSVAAVEAKLISSCASGEFAGVVVAEKNGVEVLHHVCGLADIAAGKAVTDQTVFKAFSIAKSVTGIVVMRLLESGEMGLDEPISAYLHDIPHGWRNVTVRQLLQHTSGLPDLTQSLLSVYQSGVADHDAAMRQVLSGLEGENRPLTAPGQTWRYNNFGYELLALAISRTRQMPYSDIVRSLVFAPAGMTTADWELPPPWTPHVELAQGYVGTPAAPRPTQSLVYIQQGAGALHASYSDFLALADSLRNGALISAEMMQKNIDESFFDGDPTKYGFGMMVRKTNDRIYLQHSGGNNGFVADFAMAPDEDTTVIILSNRGYVAAESLRRDLMAALLAD